MRHQAREFTLKAYLDVIRRHRLLIVAVAVICAGGAVAYSLTAKRSYSATAALQVSDPNQSYALLGSTYVPSETALQLASAAAPQVTRPEVVSLVKRQLASPLSPDQLRNRIAVAVNPNSYLVQITATAPSAAGAASLANAFASADALLTTREVRAEYRAQARSVARDLHKASASLSITSAETLARLQNLSSVADPLQIAQTATPPSSPSSPKPLTYTLAALLFGLLLGIAIAVARDALDRRLRNSTDVARTLDEPILGHIRSQALGHAPGDSAAANSAKPFEDVDEESFRILRENIRYLSADALRTVLVTSAVAQEGKSTVAAGLALAMAQSGRRTLLVECDLRRPVLAGRFGLAEKPGLTDYLTANAQPQEILQTVAVSTPTLQVSANGNGASPSPSAPSASGEPLLVCITAGTSVPRPAELLASTGFKDFIAEVSQVYDTVILDSAPLLPVADTLGLVSDSFSALLLCLRINQTTRDQAHAAKAALERLPTVPVALVLTDVRRQDEGYYYGYYGAVRPPVTSAA